LLAGDDDEMFMAVSLNVTSKTTEQDLIARSDKSVAYVVNNKRLCLTFCTVEANLLADTKRRTASLRQQSYLPVIAVITWLMCDREQVALLSQRGRTMLRVCQ